MQTFTVSGQSYFTGGFICLVFNGKGEKMRKTVNMTISLLTSGLKTEEEN